MLKLGVNIDHVATVREARKTFEPDPVHAAFIAQQAGAHCITFHLREDRRHIQDRDVELLKQTVTVKLNMEMANVPEIVDCAIKTKPQQVTLVPEKREEITTEGGLNVIANQDALSETVKKLEAQGITVSLFVDPIEDQIRAAHATGAPFIELHTGCYANAQSEKEINSELERFVKAARLAQEFGVRIHAGHGLTYDNVCPMKRIPGIEDLNIGHSIISRAVFVGLDQAVRDMLGLLG